MRTAGEILKAKRIGLKYDINYISDNLKIRSKYIEAIEDNDYSAFSSPLIIKGFIKNYAKFLKLNPENILAIYRRDFDDNFHNATQVGEKKKKSVKRSEGLKNFVIFFNPSILWWLFALFVFIGFFIFLFTELKGYIQNPKLSISSPQNNQVFNSPELIISGTITPGDNLYINNTKIYNIDTNGNFNYTFDLTNVSNTINIKTVNYFNRSTEVTLHETLDNITTSTNGNLNLRIVDKSSATWVEVIGDGKILQNGVLSSGSINDFSSNDFLIIESANPNNLAVSINGQIESLTMKGSASYNKFALSSNGSVVQE